MKKIYAASMLARRQKDRKPEEIFHRATVICANTPEAAQARVMHELKTLKLENDGWKGHEVNVAELPITTVDKIVFEARS